MRKFKRRFTIAKKEKITSSTKSNATNKKLRLVDVRAVPAKLVKY